MTSKERIKAIFEGNDLDRPALYDQILNDAIIKHFAGEEPDMDNPKPVVNKALSEALDATRMMVTYPQKAGKRTLEDGTIIDQKRWTVWTELPIKSVDDAKDYVKRQIKTNNESDIDIKGIIEGYEETCKGLGDIFLFANFLAKTGIMLYAEVGLELFSYLMVDSPDLIADYYDAVTKRTIRSIDAHDFPDSVYAVFDCEDVAYKGGLLLPPNYLRKEFIPRFEGIVDAWHKKGIKFVYHSDGDLSEILPDLVSCGIDGLNPIETQAGFEIPEIRKIAPDLILIGGVDCSQILPNGTPDEVRAETEKVLRQAGPKSLIGSSSEVQHSVPLENYLTMRETVMNWKW